LRIRGEGRDCWGVDEENPHWDEGSRDVAEDKGKTGRTYMGTTPCGPRRFGSRKGNGAKEEKKSLERGEGEHICSRIKFCRGSEKGKNTRGKNGVVKSILGEAHRNSGKRGGL